MRIGFFDMKRAVRSSKEAAKVTELYQGEVKRIRDSLAQKRKELEQLRADFTAKRQSMSPQEGFDKQEKIISLEKEIQRGAQDSQEALKRKNAQLSAVLMERLRRVVEEVGRAEGYSVVLDKDSSLVMFSDEKADITERVISKFDSQKAASPGAK